MADWKSPIYKYAGGKIVIDVTTSISSGLPPHRVLKRDFMPYIRKLGHRRILDFGAGALRHTLPMLAYDVEVCAGEVEAAFGREVAMEALEKARRRANFSTLIWPAGFKKDGRRFDAAVLSYVLQTMPEKEERKEVVKLIAKKLVDGGHLLYLSRTDQITRETNARRVCDGYYMWPERETHSFYTEFTHEETRALMEKFKLVRERSWSEGGKEQVFLFRKQTGEWAK